MGSSRSGAMQRRHPAMQSAAAPSRIATSQRTAATPLKTGHRGASSAAAAYLKSLFRSAAQHLVACLSTAACQGPPPGGCCRVSDCIPILRQVYIAGPAILTDAPYLWLVKVLLPQAGAKQLRLAGALRLRLRDGAAELVQPFRHRRRLAVVLVGARRGTLRRRGLPLRRRDRRRPETIRYLTCLLIHSHAAAPHVPSDITLRASTGAAFEYVVGVMRMIKMYGSSGCTIDKLTCRCCAQVCICHTGRCCAGCSAAAIPTEAMHLGATADTAPASCTLCQRWDKRCSDSSSADGGMFRNDGTLLPTPARDDCDGLAL